MERRIRASADWSVYTVCCDMYEGYIEAIREELPTARIMVDRFHVTCH